MCADFISPGIGKSEEEHRRELCAIGRALHARGFIPATDGNFSVRLDAGRILTSPTGMCKGTICAEDLVITDLQGRKLQGPGEPTSELGMHLLIYGRRPDVHAVCHAHPPYATAHAVAGVPLNKAILGEVIVTLGWVPLAPYGTTGTPELADALAPLVQQHDAILLANHGVVTCGFDLRAAFCRMETVEHYAQVSLLAGLLGGQVLLSNCDVRKLVAARARCGIATGTSLNAALPVTRESTACATPSESEQISLTRDQLETLIKEAIRKDRTLR